VNESVVALPAVLALELADGEHPGRLSLTRDEARELAALIADDLRLILPGVDAARLAVVGALFDTVELLRPGFPLYATLDELAQRIPRVTGEAAVVAFGSNDGQMPAQALVPEPAFADGPMRLLPWTLLAPAGLAAELAASMEVELVGRGEAGARTADFLMRTLGARFEHARYLSRDDVLAMTCVQYEHVNLAPLWTLLEGALLTPYQPESTVTVRGLPMRYEGGHVRVPPLAGWFAATRGDAATAAHELAALLFELRQYAAVLGAHHLPLAFDGGPASPGFLVEAVAPATPGAAPPRLYAHQARGLGLVAITVAEADAGARPRVLAHGYPLAPDALPAMLAALDAAYGVADDITDLGQIVLDDERRLGAPPAAVH
jgi:hypothetical protein